MQKIISSFLMILFFSFLVGCTDNQSYVNEIEKFSTIIGDMSDAEFYEIVNGETQIFNIDKYILYFNTEQTEKTCKSELVLETSDDIQETIMTIDKRIHALYWADKQTIVIVVFQQNELSYSPRVFEYYYFNIVSQTLSMDGDKTSGENVWHYGVQYVIREALSAEYPEQKDVFVMKNGELISLAQKIYPFFFSNESLYYMDINQQVECLNLINLNKITFDFCNNKGTLINVAEGKIVQWDGQQISVGDSLTQEELYINQPLWGVTTQITKNGLYHLSSKSNLCYTDFDDKTTQTIDLDIGEYLCSAFRVVGNKVYTKLTKVNDKEYESYVKYEVLNDN